MFSVLIRRRPPVFTLFPYTTLFRSQIFVSGTTARAHHLDGDAYKQMMAAIATVAAALGEAGAELRDRKSTRLNSSHANISYAVFCLKKKKKNLHDSRTDSKKPITEN